MNRMRELRLENNKTMKQAAKELEMPYTTYVNYEKGLREPNSEVLIKIAKYFSVSIDYLLGHVNDPSFHLDNRQILNELNDRGENEKMPTQKGEHDPSEIMFALSRGGEKEITDEMFEEVKRFAAFIAEREGNKK